MTGADRPFASVVVPTRNRALILHSCIASLAAQDADGFEVIVVDDGSTDSTPSLARLTSVGRDIPVRYVRLGGHGVNAARNAGIRNSIGALIIFIDDDYVAPPDWLNGFLRAVRDYPEAGCYMGPILWRLEGQPPRICESHKLDGDFHVGSEPKLIDIAFGGNMAIRRESFMEVGFFDDKLSGWGDELEWVRRYRRVEGVIYYEPTAWIWHRRQADDLSLRRLVRQSFRRGNEAWIYYRTVGVTIDWRWLLGPVWELVTHLAFERCSWSLLALSWRAGIALNWARSRRF